MGKATRPRDARPVISVDLGGTNTRVAVVAHDGEILDRVVEPTAREDMHPDELFALVVRVASGRGARGAVVGVPGRVHHTDGRLEYAPNLPAHWAPHLNEKRLREAVGMPVSLANDADLAAVGEHRFGAGRGHADMVYLTISTGVGCGVILGGMLVHGHRSLAEVGHTTIDRRATDEGRTLEGSASGTALARIAARRGLQVDGRALVELVRKLDPTALAVWEEVVGAAGFGVANLAHLYSPEVIVVGGGLGLTSDLLHDPLREALDVYGPRELPKPIAVVRAELGDDAGLAGAAGWAAAFGGRTRDRAGKRPADASKPSARASHEGSR
jgi:glucokinase